MLFGFSGFQLGASGWASALKVSFSAELKAFLQRLVWIVCSTSRLSGFREA
jgi:hypothetical protein